MGGDLVEVAAGEGVVGVEMKGPREGFFGFGIGGGVEGGEAEVAEDGGEGGVDFGGLAEEGEGGGVVVGAGEGGAGVVEGGGGDREELLVEGIGRCGVCRGTWGLGGGRCGGPSTALRCGRDDGIWRTCGCG